MDTEKRDRSIHTVSYMREIRTDDKTLCYMREGLERKRGTDSVLYEIETETIDRDKMRWTNGKTKKCGKDNKID